MGRIVGPRVNLAEIGLWQMAGAACTVVRVRVGRRFMAVVRKLSGRNGLDGSRSSAAYDDLSMMRILPDLLGPSE